MDQRCSCVRQSNTILLACLIVSLQALPETVYFRCLRPLSNKQIDSFLNSFVRGNNIEINNAIAYGLLGVYYGNLFMKSEIERSEDAEYYFKIYEKYHSKNDLGKEL